MRPRIAGICGMPLSVSPWGRSRPHLSLREGLKQTPFPLALDRSRSVLAVKGSLRRYRALDGSGPIRRDDCLRGERGGARSGGIVHDKGYYHSYTEAKPKGNLSAIPDA